MRMTRIVMLRWTRRISGIWTWTLPLPAILPRLGETAQQTHLFPGHGRLTLGYFWRPERSPVGRNQLRRLCRFPGTISGFRSCKERAIHGVRHEAVGRDPLGCLPARFHPWIVGKNRSI